MFLLNLTFLINFWETYSYKQLVPSHSGLLKIIMFSWLCILPVSHVMHMYVRPQYTLKYKSMKFNAVSGFNSMVLKFHVFVCRLRSYRPIGITLSVVRPSVTIFCHAFQSYVSQVTHAFLGMLPLFFNKVAIWGGLWQSEYLWQKVVVLHLWNDSGG